MECKNCGCDNAPLKRSCERCGKILEGYCINNITGNYGYRHADGSFTEIVRVTESELQRVLRSYS